MSVQTTIPFNIRKKTSMKKSFYGIKENLIKEDFSNATVPSSPTTGYKPVVKKIVTLSSSESDSDSDVDCSSSGKGRINYPSKKTNDATPKRNKRASDSDDKHGSTPPKQKKTHSPETPSSLLSLLKLDKSDKLDKADNLEPRRLFGSSRYQNARKALHSSTPTVLPGRETELAELQTFLREHLKEKKSGSLYVSGPPGTGKTACLSRIMLEPDLKSSFKVIYVNCTTMKSAGTIYAKIVQDLGLNVHKTEKANKAVIERHLRAEHKMLLLVLDEIDQLDSKKQLVLYTIFEWPSVNDSKLVLVGIANALDLTDRILPRLQARCELKPKLMHFAPYTKQQIIHIINQRLKEADVPEILSGVAMQMLAGKVAAISGDIRRALDISRRVIDIAETQRNMQVLQPCNDNDSNTNSPKKQQATQDKPVALKDVVAVLNNVYGGVQNINNEESTFPLQQKLLLCSLMLILNKSKHKDVTIGKLHEVYKKVCKKRNIYAVDTSEFVGLCALVETRGVLQVVRKKEPRLSKVNLQWDQEELGAALKDKNMMAEIINDASCL